MVSVTGPLTRFGLTVAAAACLLDQASKFYLLAVFDLAANWGLLLAIAALGAGTTVTELRYINWRHGAVFFMATAVILLAVALGLRITG